MASKEDKKALLERLRDTISPMRLDSDDQIALVDRELLQDTIDYLEREYDGAQ